MSKRNRRLIKRVPQHVNPPRSSSTSQPGQERGDHQHADKTAATVPTVCAVPPARLLRHVREVSKQETAGAGAAVPGPRTPSQCGTENVGTLCAA